MKTKIAILIALYCAVFVLAMAGCIREPVDKGKWNPWVPRIHGKVSGGVGAEVPES